MPELAIRTGQARAEQYVLLGDDNYVGMDFIDPPVDFTGLAKSLGLEATRVTDPGQLKSVLSSAFTRPGAKLIEVVASNSVN